MIEITSPFSTVIEISLVLDFCPYDFLRFLISKIVLLVIEDPRMHLICACCLLIHVKAFFNYAQNTCYSKGQNKVR